MSIFSFRPLYPKSKLKQFLLIVSVITILIPVVLILRLLVTIGFIPYYREHWHEQLKQEPAPNAIRLVGLGDSAMQGVGAHSPAMTLFGRVERYIEQETGRPVYGANISVSGAKAGEVVSNQVPRLKELNPDIIIVSVSGNDANQQIDLDEFKRNINELFAALPKDKTVVSDVPGVNHRDPYQPILLAAAKRHGLRVAPVYENFAPHDDKFSSYAGDFFHPSSKGYEYWFNAYREPVKDILSSLDKKR